MQRALSGQLLRDPPGGEDLFGWWRIHNERVLETNGVPLEDFRGL